MKRAESIFSFIVSFIAFVSIVVVIVTGINNNKEESDSTMQKEVTKIETGEFNKINISLLNSNIQVLDSVDNTIKIVYFEREGNTYTYSAEGGFLQLVERSSFSLFSCRGFNFRPETAKLYLPIDWEGVLKIESTNGSLKLENRTGLKRLTMESTNGSIILSNVEVVEYVELDITNGSLEVKRVNAGEYVTAETTNGTVRVDNVEAAEYVTAKTTNGEIKATNLVSEKLEIATTNGEITVNNATFNRIKVHTTNSSINVTIKGTKEDYSIEMDTVNGSVYLNDEKISKGTISTGKEKEITLTTTNGSVKLKFIE